MSEATAGAVLFFCVVLSAVFYAGSVGVESLIAWLRVKFQRRWA